MIFWILTGFVAGVLAKVVTPQDEKGGWVSSIVIGLLGSMLGGFITSLLGLGFLNSMGILGDILVAFGGSVLLLFIYHRYLADKLNFPI